MVNINHYVNLILEEALDRFVKDNIDSLTGRDLANFYRQLFEKLKEYFGGSWGFNGVTEFLILRVLYYVGIERYNEKPERRDITKDLKGFYFTKHRLVLSAGRPLTLGENKKRIDIIVYEASKDNIADIYRLKSAIEIKAYPQKGIKGIRETIERLKEVYGFYSNHNPKLALIVYDYTVQDKSRSKVWKYLRREPVKGYEPIPKYIDTIVLSEVDKPIKDLLAKYILVKPFKECKALHKHGHAYSMVSDIS